MSRLTLPQLTAFMKVASTRSFSEAAVQLGISQPALSRSIQHIEIRVGTRLFDREKRTVSLTPAGERLMPLAERLLNNYAAMFRDLQEFVDGREGLIRIAALPSVATTLLPKAIGSFQARHPNVHFEIFEDVGDPLHDLVHDRAVDFGIGPPPRVTNELRYQELLKDDLVFVCKADDPLSSAARHDWSVFTERRFIATSPDTGLRKMVESGMAQAGVIFGFNYNCKQVATIASLIAAGQGISALTRLAMEQLASPALAWRPLVSPTVSMSVGALRHFGRSLSPTAQLFLQEFEHQARSLRLDDRTTERQAPRLMPAAVS